MFDEDTIGRHKTEIDTPALLLYMDAAERNIAKMADFFSDKPCKLRPHIKTHKLPLIAHKQIDAGAIGITCAKLGEAKVFLESGIKNVLIANEIVGEKKIPFRKRKGYFRGCWKDRSKNQCPRGSQCRVEPVWGTAWETSPGVGSGNNKARESCIPWRHGV